MESLLSDESDAYCYFLKTKYMCTLAGTSSSWLNKHTGILLVLTENLCQMITYSQHFSCSSCHRGSLGDNNYRFSMKVHLQTRKH